MSDKPRVVLTEYDEKDEHGNWVDPPGCREDKLKGCLCILVKQRHSWDEKNNGNNGYYGHAQGILAQGKGYYMTVIDETCPLHGNKESEATRE